MIQVFGDFIEKLPVSQEHLTIQFSPSSIPLRQRWRNNGLSADFLADYFATFLSGSEGKAAEARKHVKVKSAVSYIANELLENVMKFNDEVSQAPTSIQLQLCNDSLVFLTVNSISSQRAQELHDFISHLSVSDANELYMHQLEQSDEDGLSPVSGLGILTMIHDYGAKIGWKFETVQKDAEIILVTIMVQLTV